MPETAIGANSRVRTEQLRLLYGAPVVLLINVVNALITVAVLRYVYPAWMIVCWLGAIVVLVAGRLVLWRRFKKATRNQEVAPKWGTYFVIGSTLTGGAWGLLASVIFMTDDPIYYVFVAFLIGGMLAGATLRDAAYLPAFYGFALAAAFPAIIAFLAKGGSHLTEMGLLMAAFAIVLMLVGRDNNRWITNSVQSRINLARANEELRRTEAQILHLVRNDMLTGLPNRRAFVEGLQQAIARARRGGSGLAVLYLDLDHFKDVNDTNGHPVGDLLLKSIAERLRAVVRETDVVARLGGDEFAIVATDVDEPAAITTIADKVMGIFGEPFTIQGNEIRSGTTIGISIYGPQAPDPETLLSQADVALYRAKSEGRGTYRFFSQDMEAEVRHRVTMAAELRTAIAERQFFLLYQPQVEVENGRIVGVEALLRWRHPTRGIIEPAAFVAIAERNGLIVPVEQLVLREACRQARQWLDAGLRLPLMAVNLSGVQFKSALEVESDVVRILSETGLPPSLLELELTESVFMEASQDQSDVLVRLREAGLRIAIDDFGTGYSSLDYLRRFPVDRIKVAQTFVKSIESETGSAVIVRAALGLARELNLRAIVEGVENEAQLELLKSWGCHEVQGYYFARPQSAEDMTEFLRAGYIQPARSA